MSFNREKIEDLIFGQSGQRRFTQDSPILPDVWIAYCRDISRPVDLLLNPRRESSPPELHKALSERLVKKTDESPNPWSLAYNESYVAADLSFEELICIVLPLSGWWNDYVWGRPSTSEPQEERKRKKADKRPITIKNLEDETVQGELADLILRPGTVSEKYDVSTDLLWLIRIVGSIEVERHARPAGAGGGRREESGGSEESLSEIKEQVKAFHKLVKNSKEWKEPPLLWSVSCNRQAEPAVWQSVPSVKADAASRLFHLKCGGIAWAIVDSGIDARHPAFRKRAQNGTQPLPVLNEDAPPGDSSRVVKTYDFTRIRNVLGIAMDKSLTGQEARISKANLEPEKIARLRNSLLSGRAIDWGALEPILRVSHEKGYLEPECEHGTHVAGILGADWRTGDPDMPDDHDIIGVCPDIQLYDFRVLDREGKGDEFAVLAALQFIRYLNANKDQPVIHGVNLSISIRHDVANFACGRTPVCDECERLVGAGVVVVAAAGNDGYAHFLTVQGLSEGYRSISITDPGNAEAVITVGATHRFKPHTYGVSYFSSRGPTGDGRTKPDLVAPGEKIKAPVPGRLLESLDGTSMAAPHVSGAAALLMARHNELMGQPARVKQILCETATDLKRERFFQGHGMVDVLRAIQSV